ncbi:MAG: archaeosine biosynthesis radical SAM protein RaSEA [Archaeoglobales archaeon]|nr:archaeosine biosynthesis radical SAM protein RaSEA [Archaeoglobales archaeon]
MEEDMEGGRSVSTDLKFWREKERLKDEIVDCLTAIITTRGCAWNRCYMCSYARESRQVSEKELIEQIDAVFKNKAKVYKIFTSGSFFDDSELPKFVREYVARKFKEVGAEKLIVESRPEFIEEDKLSIFEDINLEVGIGLESADDFIREKCVNKGFKFEDFLIASKKLKSFGFRVKAYLLLKPPFLSEKEAVEDALNSIKKIESIADVVSLNLTNVQKNTLVEKLWYAGLYRPPWLWSAIEVLRKSDLDIICDPVAAGKSRGPHNCYSCDLEVAKAIRNFSLTQDKSYLEVYCECKRKWEVAIELENYSRVPIFF